MSENKTESQTQDELEPVPRARLTKFKITGYSQDQLFKQLIILILNWIQDHLLYKRKIILTQLLHEINKHLFT